MELHQLRYFVAVAEHGGFSRAAEHCRVAQPSLSFQIKRLETELGQPLFDRLKRGVALTEAGRLLLPRAQRILAEVREAGEAIERDLSQGRGTVHLGAIPTIAPYLLPPAFERFTKSFPESSLHVHEDYTERLVTALVGGELDFAVLSTPLDHPALEVEVIGLERLLVALPPAFADRHPGPPSIADLTREPAVVLHEMHCLSRQIQGFCTTRRLRQSIVCRTAQLTTVQTLVAAGLGVSLVPEMCAKADTSGSVLYAPLAGEPPTREIAIAWRSDRSRSFLARELVRLLREDLESGRHRLEA